MPSTKQTWEPRERRLVSEWTRIAFPTAHVKENVRIGAIVSAQQTAKLTDAEMRAVGQFRRWVDALVIEKDRVHLVEGKIRNTPGALEQLDLYERLFPLTPEFADIRDLPVEKHLVWVVNDPVVESMARERNIRVHVYRPAWAEQYLATLVPNVGRPRATGPLTLPFGEE